MQAVRRMVDIEYQKVDEDKIKSDNKILKFVFTAMTSSLIITAYLFAQLIEYPIKCITNKGKIKDKIQFWIVNQFIPKC